MPHQLLDKNAWDILGTDAAYMLAKLFLEEPVPTKGAKEEIHLLRELMEIGKVSMLEYLSSGDLKCFGRKWCIDRVKQIGRRMHEVTKIADHGFVEWLFSCDMLSFPDWAIQELKCLWNGVY
jgi:hypothetical protein